MKIPALRLSPIACAVIFLAACGGGGGGSSSFNSGSGSTGGANNLAIATASILPSTIGGHAYSTTLQATGGSGALHWSIAKVGPTVLFVDGLTIDANSGTLAGTVGFLGTAGFVATVTDSASGSATKGFTVTAGTPLTAGANQNISIRLFDTPMLPGLGVQGGAQPLAYSISSGTLPPGMRLNASTGAVTGSTYTGGTYPVTITIQDSLSPPEIVTQMLTYTILPANLSLGSSLPPFLPINSVFSGSVVAAGGTPPYIFSAQGALPVGLTLDTSTGTISGTPTVPGSNFFFMQVRDSASPQQQNALSINLKVGPRIGRNDTPATASIIGPGSFTASISPYVDPPNSAPLPADHDYYRIIASPGQTVHAETFARRNSSSNPLDSVIEILDLNGHRLNTCRQPGDTSNNFTSPCINDDISLSPHVQDSALDFQAPPSGATAPFYVVHVFDWTGNARPDMVYNLQVNGNVQPLKILTTSLFGVTKGSVYSAQMDISGGSNPILWTLNSGTLPPGLNLSSSGMISGTATVDGVYPFELKAQDSLGQTAAVDLSIEVGEPVHITSSATFPDACVNKPYFLQLTNIGGVAPLFWGFTSSNWVAINLNQSAGTFSGTPTVLGTYLGVLSLTDSAYIRIGDSQNVTLHVVTCP